MFTLTSLDRRGLPKSFHYESTHPQLPERLLNASFEELHDALLIEPLKVALLEKSVEKVFNAIAALLKCDFREILLLQPHHLNRNGQQTAVTYFRFINNLAFDQTLQTAGETQYYSAWQARNLVVTDAAISALVQPVREHFRYVVDFNSLQIFRRLQCSPSQVSTPFGLIPFHLEVSFADVIESIRQHRPQDRVERFHIHSGTAFVAVEDSFLCTQMPFLLFRYSVVGSHPRFVSFSTLANQIDLIEIDDAALIERMISQYCDACRSLNTPAFSTNFSTDDNAPLGVDLFLLEEEGDRQRFQGGFARFNRSIDRFDRTFAEMQFAPMVSDYITLARDRYAPNCAASEIVAYVESFSTKRAYFDRIAAFFGGDPGDYPIIFPKADLEQWDELSDSKFLATVAQEMGCWLVAEDIFSNTLSPTKSRYGIRWAIYTDLIELLLIEEQYCRTRRGDYYPDDPATNRAIEAIVQHGITAVRTVRGERKLTKATLRVIAQMLHGCVDELISENWIAAPCLLPAPSLDHTLNHAVTN